MKFEKEIKRYAVGALGIKKYKKFIDNHKHSKGNFISMDWVLPKHFDRIRRKIVKRFIQTMKNYSMVSRLKKVKC